MLTRLFQSRRLLRFLPLALLGVVTGACSDGHSVYRPGPGEDPWQYPITLRTLDEQERAARLARFRERNPRVCVSIDPFGRLAAGGGCVPDLVAGVADSAEAARVAADFLERNREFFYLTGRLPAVRRVYGQPGQTWFVEFALQSIDGIEVWDTRIGISLDQSVFLAWGGHYPECRIPERLNLDPEEARASLPPVILYPCWGPIEAYLVDTWTLVAFPLPVGPAGAPTGIELRTAYRLTYSDSGQRLLLEYVFVDAMDGARIASVPLIVCANGSPAAGRSYLLTQRSPSRSKWLSGSSPPRTAQRCQYSPSHQLPPRVTR